MQVLYPLTNLAGMRFYKNVHSYNKTIILKKKSNSIKDGGQFTKLSIKISFSPGCITILSALSHSELRVKLLKHPESETIKRKNNMLQTVEKVFQNCMFT